MRSAGRRDDVLGLAVATSTVVLFLGVSELTARIEEPAGAKPAAYITDWQAWDGDFYTVKSAAVGWPPWEDYNVEGLRDPEHTLGAIGAREAAPALVRAVRDPAENVRLAAVTGLIEVAAAPPLATPAFLQALADADSRVRLRAVRGLARAGGSAGAHRGLERASTDPDATVRAQAVRALRREVR